MAIEETIDVSVAGIGQVDALAAALDKAAESAARLNGMVAKGGAGAGGGASSAGADKMAASMDAAAARTEKAVKRMSAAMESMSGIGDAAAAGLGPAADAIDAVAAANGRLAESGKLAANAQRAVARATAAAGKAMDKTAEGTDAAAAANSRVARTSGESAAALDAQAVAATRAGRSHATAAESSTKFWKGVKVAAVGGAVAVAYGIDKAMHLQSQVTRLYTAAGLQGVKQDAVTRDVLGIGSKTGFSGEAIAEAMYHPVSAGLDYKTAKGLTEQSANLANVHGANLDDTTFALSSVMKAYNQGAKQVLPTAALLNSIVGQGDMKFQDFNEAVKNFAPTGASMGISLQSMGAGLAYLTDRGNTAEVASTRLTMGLGMATAGSKAANTYLKDLGLTTGSLTLKNKSLQKTMEAGGLTTNKFAADLKKPDGLYVALNDMQHAFTKAGLSSSQADTVMSKIFGGGRSDKAIVSLMQNLDGLRQKYEDIGKKSTPDQYMAAVKKEQDTAQQKWKDFLASSQNLAAGFGNTMLPAFTKIAGLGASLLQGPGGGIAGGALGGAMALFAGKKIFGGVESAAGTIGKVAKFLNVPGLSKLSGIGRTAGADAATAGLTAVGGAADGAAAALGRLGGIATEEGVAGGLAGGKGAALAEEEAVATGGLGNLLKTGAGGLMTGGLVAALAIPLAMQADKAIQKHLGNTQASGWAQIGVGGAAGAATGAAAGSVIPGLGTGIGAIAGALIGGVTTALKNHKVWEDVAGAPGPPGKPKYKVQQGPWAPPLAGRPTPATGGTGGLPLPVPGSARPAKDPTLGWAIANAIDQKRDSVVQGVRKAGSLANQAADFTGGSLVKTRDQFAQVLAMFGIGGGSKKPPAPSLPPGVLPQGTMPTSRWQRITGSTGYYPNGNPFLGEVPVQQRPVAAPPVARVAPGKLAALSMPAPKPVKIPPPDLSAVTAVKAKLMSAVSNVQVKPLKIPAPDMSAVGAAKGKIQALSQVTLKAPKMPAPDMSALDSAKGKAASAGSGITGAIQGAMKPAKMPAPDLSAASGAVGTASGIGSAIGAGLATGIRSQIGAVQAAAAALANAASAAMAAAAVVRSPSKKTEKIGKDVAAGLVVGLEGGSGAVKAAAKALGNDATKAPDIKSIDDTIAKLKKKITGKPAMVMFLEEEQDRLHGLARNRARLETEITNSEQAAQSAISGASIMNALNAQVPGSAEPIASGAIVQGQGYQATNLAAFAKQLTSLQKAGLNATELSQIAQAGPDQGLGIAQGITSGGKDAINQLNAIQKKIHTSAIQIGDVTGTAMYQSGQDIGQGLAAGLKAALKTTEKDIEKEAKRVASIIDQVSKNSKAKGKAAGKAHGSGPGSSSGGGSSSGSPGPGGTSAAAIGNVKGWDGAAAKLSAAGGSLSAAATALSAAASAFKKDTASAKAGGPHPLGSGGGHMHYPVSSGGGGGGGGMTVIHNHHYNIAGSVVTTKTLAKDLQGVFLDQADRNLRTGLKRKDRGA